MIEKRVPSSTKIRPSRVKNIDTDRLERRLNFLNENKAAYARQFDGRKALRDLARELLTIEYELKRRSSRDEGA